MAAGVLEVLIPMLQLLHHVFAARLVLRPHHEFGWMLVLHAVWAEKVLGRAGEMYHLSLPRPHDLYT